MRHVAEELETAQQQTFRRAAISNDGQYAIIAFVAGDGFEDLNHMQLVKYDNGEWITVLTASGEGNDIPMRNPTIDLVEASEDGDTVYFADGLFLQLDSVPSSSVRN